MSTLNNDNKKENRAMNAQRKTTMTRRREKCILAEWVSIRRRWKRHHYENERRIKRGEGRESERKYTERRRRRRT